MGKNKFYWTVCLVLSVFAAPSSHAVSNTSVESNLQFKTTDLGDITTHIKESASLMTDWISEINQTDYKLLCLGETHNDEYRHFYGEVIQELDFYSLALETNDEAFSQLMSDWEQEKPLYLLNATFDPIAEALKTKQPPAVLHPVEVTQEQKKFSLDQQLETGKREHSRDGFIASNIVSKHTEGQKMVALYGSHHCSLNNQGVGTTPYANHLKKHWGTDKVITVKVLFRDSISTDPLLSFVDSISEFRRKTVVVSSQKLKPEMHNYNWKIMKLTENYDFIVFK